MQQQPLQQSSPSRPIRQHLDASNNDIQSQSVSSATAEVLWQRSLGNQSMMALLNSGTVQARLKVGQHNDRYEQEADRIASHIVALPSPTASADSIVTQQQPSGVIQRTCASCSKEYEDAEQEHRLANVNQLCPKCLVQRKPVNHQMTPLLAGGSHTTGGGMAASPTMDIQTLIGCGRPLSDAERQYFEPRFGQNFDQVRLHTNDNTAQMASSLNARAFTVGLHIVFGNSEYQPSTKAGQHLIAHELVHTLQQRSNQPQPSQPQSSQPRSVGATPTNVETTGTTAAPLSIQRDAEEGSSASTLDEALDTLRSAGQFVPGLQPLIASIDIIRAAYDLYQRREEILQQIVDSIDEHIREIPAEAHRLAREHAASLGPIAAEGAHCILDEMVGLLESLAEHWREVITSMLRDMLIVPLLERSIPTIVDNVIGIVEDIGNGELGSAVDRAVDLMTEINAIAGVLFLWYAIIITVGGTAAGSVEPGGGNAAGAVAGMTLSEILGVTLLSSVVATEITRVVRGIQAMSEHWDDQSQRQEGCREVAEGVFALAVTAALFFIGPYVQRFAREIIARARAMANAAAEALSQLRVAQPLVPATAGPQGSAMPFVRQTPPVRQPSPAPSTQRLPTQGASGARPGRTTPARPPSSATSSATRAGTGGAIAADPRRRVQEDDEETPGPHRMRSQIQQGRTHFGSAVVDASDASRGVTAREFELTQARARENALEPADPRSGKSQLSRSNIPGVNRAKAEQSRLIRNNTIPAGGIPETRIGDINELRVCFNPNTNALMQCGGRVPIRLDVENLAGHNLRYPR